ncbi:hypothetical protein NEOKW01_0584 [Nematocida sp. AWRm80]|nr:hypothetical protein NEOKW01_0584 [Nematocida sp. AWRm80]
MSISPSYSALLNKSRGYYSSTYLFKGTKIDISKELFDRSVFSLSNGEDGLGINYSIGVSDKVLSGSAFGNGTLVGKITNNDARGGFSITAVSSGKDTTYLDIEYTRSCEYGSFTLKMINPKLEPSVETKLKESLSKVRNTFTTTLKRTKEQPHTPTTTNSPSTERLSTKDTYTLDSITDIAHSCKGFITNIPNLKNTLLNRATSLKNTIREGIFSAGGVLQLTPTMHLGIESILSLDKQKDNHLKKIITTGILSKMYNTWRVLGLIQTTGNIGLAIEKTLDDYIVMYTDVFIDALGYKNKQVDLFNSITGIAGLSITGHHITTRVSASTEGILGVCSDISVSDGAQLNVGAELSSEGTQLGLGISLTG